MYQIIAPQDMSLAKYQCNYTTFNLLYVIGLISIMCQCYMFKLTEYAYVGQCAIHFVCLFYGILNPHLNPVLKCIFPTGVYRVAPA